MKWYYAGGEPERMRPEKDKRNGEYGNPEILFSFWTSYNWQRKSITHNTKTHNKVLSIIEHRKERLNNESKT